MSALVTAAGPDFIDAAKAILAHGVSLNARNLAEALEAVYASGRDHANTVALVFQPPVDTQPG